MFCCILDIVLPIGFIIQFLFLNSVGSDNLNAIWIIELKSLSSGGGGLRLKLKSPATIGCGLIVDIALNNSVTSDCLVDETVEVPKFCISNIKVLKSTFCISGTYMHTKEIEFKHFVMALRNYSERPTCWQMLVGSFYCYFFFKKNIWFSVNKQHLCSGVWLELFCCAFLLNCKYKITRSSRCNLGK